MSRIVTFATCIVCTSASCKNHSQDIMFGAKMLTLLVLLGVTAELAQTAAIGGNSRHTLRTPNFLTW
ncbi:hypothetical protein B566_EDAN013040 [Ephemera danica]|nr:hypothetical protein B566_EDAN013040 [Ephemera danica]